MMKRIVMALFFLGTGLLIACLIAPSFIDWNQHRAEIMAQISPYFQRKIDVTGNVSFKILPRPQIMLESVTVQNAAGASADSFMTLKSLEARIRLMPLLQGRVEVENINLTEPVLNLEILPDGKGNWSGVWAPRNDIGINASSIQLNRVTILNGTLNYFNQLTGSKKSVGSLNLSMNADTLLGPYHVAGDMQYQNAPVSIHMDLGAADKDMTLPVDLSFAPNETLPQVKFNGILDMQSGLAMQGELTVNQGSLAPLLNVDFLNVLGFMHDAVDMTAGLEFKGDQLNVTDIKAKFGEKGDLKGKLSLQFSHGGKPMMTLDAEGGNLTVTAKPADSYMDIPRDFEGSLHFKGKNILWEGRHLDGIDISMAFNQQDWAIKSAQLSLPGNSQIKLAGTVTPKTDTAAFASVQINSEDLGRLVSAFAPPESNIFSALAGDGSIKKIALSSGLEISPAKISFFNIDATIGDQEKISGVLNLDRAAANANFTAKLHFLDWDESALSEAFLKKITKSSGDMELTASNYTKNGLKIPELSFKGKSGAQGLEIQELKGTLADKENFIVKGHIAAFAPVSGMDISYSLKASHDADILKSLNIDLPPPLLTWKNFDIKGSVKGDAQKYSFTAQGNGDDLAWQMVHISHPVLTVTADPSTVKISSMEGTVWGGKFHAEGSFSAQKSQWSSVLKGTIKQADLSLLQKQLGFKGFSAGMGDMDFDLAAADNTPAAVTGDIGLKASTVKTEQFNFDKLGDTVHQLTDIPSNLQQIVDNTFHNNGDTIFKGIEGHFKLNQGKLNIETLKLPGAYGDLAVTGSADPAAGNYNLSGDLHLDKPADFPVLKVLRTSEMADYTVDSKPLETFIIKNAPVPASSAPAAAPDKDQPIQGILKRLDEPEQKAAPVAPPVAPQPQPQPQPPASPVPPAPTPVPNMQQEINKQMQQMEMQQMMPQEQEKPLPLVLP